MKRLLRVLLTAASMFSTETAVWGGTEKLARDLSGGDAAEAILSGGDQ